MREILFRGKRLDNGEWAEGYLVKTNSNTFIMYPNQFNDDLFLSPGNIFDGVDPDTVGQYTGLTDKNGKRIFEGDVFRYGFDEVAAIGVVKFGEYSFGSHFDMNNVGFYMEWNPRAMYYRNDLGYWLKHMKAEIEFIGNIHDNPDLLKGGEGDG